MVDNDFGRRLAIVETMGGVVGDELRRIREQNHQRIKDDNEFRTAVLSRLNLIEQGQKELNGNIANYQEDCTDERKKLGGRVDSIEALRGHVWRTVVIGGSIIAFLANIAIALAKK